MPSGKGTKDAFGDNWEDGLSLFGSGKNASFCNTPGLKWDWVINIPTPITMRMDKITILKNVCRRLLFLFSRITESSNFDRNFGNIL